VQCGAVHACMRASILQNYYESFLKRLPRVKIEAESCGAAVAPVSALNPILA
jgi:hypothetical protein